ncbi:helix-turn-helix domain-containing protein [Pseudonocardia alni]|uniref:helix-turn-helix domain-containing protein n=1 Tax=Pseudonocardia alni TaxID=33907 RepID=UPI0033F9881C
MSESNVRVLGPADAERTEQWNRLCVSSGLADGAWIPEHVERFDGAVHRRRLDDLVLIRMRADPFGLRYRRDSAAARFIGLSVNDLVYTERVRYRSDEEVVLAREINVWDTSRLVESEVVTPMAQTVVLVPKAALGAAGERLPPVSERTDWDTNPTTRLLRDLVLGLVQEADRLGPVAAGAVRNAIVELMPAVLDGPVPAAGGAAVSDAMRVAIRHWVDERLALGPVSPARAADHHGISVRSLHRLFAGTGETFASFVRARRLERARRDLTGSADLVQSIAVRWGYADASHFISEFRREHGVTPATYRRAGAAG